MIPQAVLVGVIKSLSLKPVPVLFTMERKDALKIVKNSVTNAVILLGWQDVSSNLSAGTEVTLKLVIFF